MNYETTKDVKSFLRHSNAIEKINSKEALEDSIDAWEYLIAFDELTLDRLLHAHLLMMYDLNSDIAGKLRDCNVSVGGRKCPDVSEINKLIKHWFKKYSTIEFCKDLPKYKKIDAIKQAHIEYERIHPFEDGNGRTGRMLLNWHRLQTGLPVLVITVGEEQKKYYDWFREDDINILLNIKGLI